MRSPVAPTWVEATWEWACDLTARAGQVVGMDAARGRVWAEEW